MDKIRNEIVQINPEFWNKFSKYLDDSDSVYNDDSIALQLYFIFELLKFMLNDANNILKDNCNNHLNILNMLCVYSLIMREFNNIMCNLVDLNESKKIEFDSISIEFIEIFDIFNHFLDVNLDQKINESNERIDKLYLKIIRLI